MDGFNQRANITAIDYLDEGLRPHFHWTAESMYKPNLACGLVMHT